VAQTHASAPVGHDPVQAILAIQRTRQRFVPGALLTVVAAIMAIPTWMFTFAAVSPGYKLRMIAAMVLAALIGLPLRLVGRVIELRLALLAGALAGPAIWLADFATMKLTGAHGSLVPNDAWFASVLTYAASAFMATYVARKDLDVSLSETGKAVALPAPQVWEDPNAVVMAEPANIFRGIMAVPGKLTLRSRQLEYVENGKDRPEPLLQLKDVTVATRGIHNKAFTVELSNGTSYRFVVFDRDKWIVHINARLAAAKTNPA
jgi:hypothetical protein